MYQFQLILNLSLQWYNLYQITNSIHQFIMEQQFLVYNPKKHRIQTQKIVNISIITFTEQSTLSRGGNLSIDTMEDSKESIILSLTILLWLPVKLGFILGVCGDGRRGSWLLSKTFLGLFENHAQFIKARFLWFSKFKSFSLNSFIINLTLHYQCKL